MNYVGLIDVVLPSPTVGSPVVSHVELTSISIRPIKERRGQAWVGIDDPLSDQAMTCGGCIVAGVAAARELSTYLSLCLKIARSLTCWGSLGLRARTQPQDNARKVNGLTGGEASSFGGQACPISKGQPTVN